MIDEPNTYTASIYSMTDFQPWPIAGLIQRCCRASPVEAPVGFDWNFTCNKARLGRCGGGWCAIFADRVEIEATREALSKVLDGAIP